MTIEIAKPDLSFTEEPEWIRQRELQWEIYCENQYAEKRKNDLIALQRYFFSGELAMPKDYGRGQKSFLRAMIDEYPLKTLEGWDYVIYQYGGFDRSKQEFTDLLEYLVLNTLTSRGWSVEEELRLWEHFLPETYLPIVQSSVATKRYGEPLSGKLSTRSVIEHFFGSIKNLLEGISDISPKYLYKVDFLISAIQVVTEHDLDTVNRLRFKLNLLFEILLQFKDSPSLPYLEQIKGFISQFVLAMNTREFEPVVTTMWEAAQKKHS
ncbi:hypothetical protein [Gynuella sunshinyii]|uniref:Uncharacterized protein n=1 Tax=Gynuella sunshinyii YC6258 TaxID=1445510 RepID=A0A0C5VHN7_9GAMM|nr:hypothetical protein [Gynuella sunshinyii]AJQ92863.1 hypothetical Protein YC6258_00813 [Gynuella sunshinyii YC6258]